MQAVASRIETIHRKLVAPIRQTLQAIGQPNFGCDESVSVEMVHHLKVLEVEGSITLHVGCCTSLILEDVTSCDTEFQMEDGAVKVLVLMPISLLKSFDERLISLIAYEDLIILREVVPPEVREPL